MNALQRRTVRSLAVAGIAIAGIASPLVSIAASEEPMVTVHGKVVDSSGRPIPRARVALLDCVLMDPAAMPWGRTTTTDAEGKYVVSLESVSAHMCVQASRGRLVSQRILVPVGGKGLLPDLILVPGAVGRVEITWPDGSPADSVSVSVTLERSVENGDEELMRVLLTEGEADSRGVFEFGPVPDVEYATVVMADAAHPRALCAIEWPSSRLLRPFEVELRLARRICGQVITHEGRPAQGLRVRSGTLGDSVETDSDGRFEVFGFPDQDPDTVEVCDRAEKHALVIRDVPVTESDLGVIRLPQLGTLVVRLRDLRGRVLRHGHASWRVVRHSGFQMEGVDGNGVVRFEGVPLNVPLTIRAEIPAPTGRLLAQEFEAKATGADEVTLNVSGAGTVIVRLHPKGAPNDALVVQLGSVSIDGRESFHSYPTSELETWVRPGLYKDLTVKARGFQDCALRNIKVRQGGPTILDVELVPR